MKYFPSVSKSVAGLIFIFGSMLDAIAISSMLQKETIIAVLILGLRAGVTEFKKLYEKQESNEPTS